MAESIQTGRGSDKFVIRLPDGLREEIKAAAKENGRSMNTEIVARLSGDPKTLRDQFAGQALSGMLAADEKRALSPEVAAVSAYRSADAMLAARKGGA
ncbi:Arc family DNA-binding protein [Rhizobium sp. P32RR-XVIII]|uniref:Arc family DNA-binding protein n=1 Tax=Rhizobium sp. P32RR-XVIII TaxID=2726738 RepID=UPI001456B455|nr:Arc family DNA-binding protein [Rhizobium sp. P32RR-XVIII]NLS03582.1 Arc family DNA-binding protein [Rhizobium sp. P32RR-XVIII]